MATHDPRREIEKLRGLLASHDKPIALLFGAGASCAVSDPSGVPLIPAIAPLGELCETAVRALGPQYGSAWESIVAEVETRYSYSNIELVLTAVRLKMAAAAHDTLAGLDVAGLAKIEAAIRRTVAQAAQPAESRIPQSLPHHALARWIRRTDRLTPVEIFTTNYDTLIERGLEDERVATFDGFVGSRQPFFLSQSLRHDELAPGRQWVRLWKIHGSVNWSWVTLKDGSRRIARGTEDEDGELILPSSYKYDESRKQPYVAILERLHRVLTEREDGILITLGYSFGDEHINAVIFDALDVRDRLHVFSLQFSDPADDHDLMTRAKSRANLVVYGRQHAVVGGVLGKWQLHEPVDRRLAPLVDIPFDSGASLPDSDEPALGGAFRLGDFKWFARFLDTIVGNDG